MNRRSLINTLPVIDTAGLVAQPETLLANNKTVTSKKFHFIGVSEAGANRLLYFYKKGLPGKFTCIDDVERFHSPDINFIQHPSPNNNMDAIDEQLNLFINKLENLFSHDEHFIIFAEWGKGCGSYLCYMIIGESNEKKLTLFVTMPFLFYNNFCIRAAACENKNADELVGVFPYNNDELLKNYGNSPQEAFDAMDEKIFSDFKTKYLK
jgi:hypothetical protein